MRRIWMNGREPSEFMPPSRMGHSNGHWDGSTLVIETKLLDKTVRDFRGELISENARIEERYELSEDGNTLMLVVTVHDPDALHLDRLAGVDNVFLPLRDYRIG